MKYLNSEADRIRTGRIRRGLLPTAGAVLLLLMAAAAVFPNAGMTADNEKQTETETTNVELLNSEYASGYAAGSLTAYQYGSSASSSGTSYVCDTKAELEEIIRDNMENRINNFSVRYQKGSNGSVLNSATFEKVMDEVFAEDNTEDPADCDYLRLSWTKAGFKALSYSSYVDYEFSFGYMTTASQEAALDATVSKIAAALSAGLQTDSQKVKAVNDYIIKYVEYDNTAENRSAYDALAEGTTICRGYSMLTYRLLEEMGIPVKIITGESNGGPHAWNLVEVGGLWYNLDVTWNDTAKTDKYYMKSDSDFANHSRDTEFATAEFYAEYPMTASSWGK